VLSAVELNDNHTFEAHEIGNVRTHRLLTPELRSKRAVPEPTPELPFGISLATP